ncbi:DUF1059 domain-containing protein [Agrobacterium vitis]|uniref:DUF1059 domain-containing protein n=1 Tax=Agrobacterium vitis TaxID=373 RepID=A0A368NKK4_AGRVI|nr:DUF1059 domain-containing protein [Agrobacterium vitis]KAA3511840.1 DUF1059 domain-containing protein [Agrobacterium vitis]KAA3525285.1 DUF1059 domain-containing protein [Agrobacterium vitis]MCF1479256.1 DUF1059 domain-containing protein [Agrobacterium vitis]MUZ74317.1 DUF1059 domain-containing protein [Agrobacterium vitis]MUZ97655.1 DUF1059 domain-containing protein [Agrobacterium vitis]
MKQFECGSLVPGCEWHTRANEEAEVVHRAVEHMRMVHGESVIREHMVQNVRARITDTSDDDTAAHKHSTTPKQSDRAA